MFENKHVELRDEQLRLEQLHLKEEKEQKAKPSGNRSNLKYRKSTIPSSSSAKTSSASNIQIVQPMQLDSNSSPTTIPMVRTNNTTKLRSIAAHNIRNNYTNTTTTTSTSTGKFLCFVVIINMKKIKIKLGGIYELIALDNVYLC